MTEIVLVVLLPVVLLLLAAALPTHRSCGHNPDCKDTR